MGISEHSRRVYEAIGDTVVSRYGNPLAYYLTPSRKRHVVDVRNMAMSIYKNETRCALSEMETLFNRHHATIIYAIRQVGTLAQVSAPYKREYRSFYKQYRENIKL